MSVHLKHIIGLLLIVMILVSCSEETLTNGQGFSKLSNKQSGIDFSNDLRFEDDFNIYKYRNFYNGGGVGISDINNDGLVDIYFTANMLPNKLYLNNGDLSFTDITENAGVAGNKNWSTGVSMADINGDGWVDIYVCNSGDVKGDNKQNELFINQGDNTFLEQAEKFGLADQGYSTHAAFFDFDKDGDLDVYLLNNSFQAIGSFNLTKNERPIRHKEGGDKLYRNDNGKFTDISEAAGIYGSVIGFGLGVTVGDIDLDGWLDIYISNDFFERDYIYMNNGDGTFRENLEDQMNSISGASMGADMADINNDGYPDIFVTEMLPEPNDRLKTKTTFENWDKYTYNVKHGYYHQFTRNMLQLNNGNGSFSEIGRMAGVEATDWSWGALINDFDNDGYKDLFIANGIHKDLTDQDYINFISTEEMAKEVIKKDGVDFKKLTDVIPSTMIPNYMYKNTGNLQFDNVTDDWGLSEPSHSNGSAYGDLDNDGDLDLVINNSNSLASIYINNIQQVIGGNNYLKVNLKGQGKNTQAIGTKLVVCVDDKKFHHEQVPVRGFQSSMDPRPNFGLGEADRIDSLLVYWYDGTKTKLLDVAINTTYDIVKGETNHQSTIMVKDATQSLFNDITDASKISFVHEENDFVDFDRDRLIYHMLSAEGPALCVADFNGDGREDFYVGGATDQEGKIYLQAEDGSFAEGNNTVFETDKISEDVDCSCVDVDGDGDQDLYVASGGNEFPTTSSLLIDRLYINNGRGNFTKSNQILPSFKFQNSSCVSAADVDGDGDQDLFVGARSNPLIYGVPVDGFLLINDGEGKYTDQTKSLSPGLLKLGMIKDGVWADIDNDNDTDLLVVGEWMGVKVFLNQDGKLTEASSKLGLSSSNGWWNKIIPADLDNDGDIDFVLGNHGLNSRFSASEEKPVSIYVNDFDRNGTAEPIICQYIGDKSYPLALKHDLIVQLPGLRKKYTQYEAYKDQTIEDIFLPEQLQNAIVTEATTLESSILLNNGAQGFELKALPVEAQVAPVFDIVVDDFNDDGFKDLLLGGNFNYAKPEVGIYEASYGVVLLGDGKGNFTYLPNRTSGLKLSGDIRNMISLKDGSRNKILIARNNESMKVIEY